MAREQSANDEEEDKEREPKEQIPELSIGGSSNSSNQISSTQIDSNNDDNNNNNVIAESSASRNRIFLDIETLKKSEKITPHKWDQELSRRKLLLLYYLVRGQIFKR